jgi:predicted DNA-binding transcriptional regulator AlpA
MMAAMPRKAPRLTTDAALLGLLLATAPLVDQLEPEDGEESPTYEAFARARFAAERALEDRPTAPKLALTRPETAAALGISVDHFDRHVRPHLLVLQAGSSKRWPVSEITKWIENTTQMELSSSLPRAGAGE